MFPLISIARLSLFFNVKSDVCIVFATVCFAVPFKIRFGRVPYSPSIFPSQIIVPFVTCADFPKCIADVFIVVLSNATLEVQVISGDEIVFPLFLTVTFCKSIQLTKFISPFLISKIESPLCVTSPTVAVEASKIILLPLDAFIKGTAASFTVSFPPFTLIPAVIRYCIS